LSASPPSLGVAAIASCSSTIASTASCGSSNAACTPSPSIFTTVP
jgi:hypothetical protein